MAPDYSRFRIRKSKRKTIRSPIFFIHGTEDEKAPYPIAELLAANQTNTYSEEWIVQDAHHELILQGTSEGVSPPCLYVPESCDEDEQR